MRRWAWSIAALAAVLLSLTLVAFGHSSAARAAITVPSVTTATPGQAPDLHVAAQPLREQASPGRPDAGRPALRDLAGQPRSDAKTRSAGVAAEETTAAATTTAEDAATSCANSFTANTPILMADGKEEPIADVKIGDKVLATDPETGRTEARPVVALIRHIGKHTMVDLTLSDGSKISTTDHHPFWDATTRTFTDAINLHVGDQVLSDHGRTLTITGEQVYDRSLTAYNLQIDGIHTYYAGSTPVLVHNSCGIPADGSGMSVDDALTQGQHWLGDGYSEPVAGSGRYVSSDGTRAFRMGDSDILGAHGGGPHVNFEELIPNPARPGRLMVGSNSHVYLTDW